MRSQLILALGAVSGFVSVAAGAFGAHSLKARLTPEMLAIFETGARYEMYHALALVLVALLVQQAGEQSTVLTASAWLFFAGTLLFSGSLYALALSDQRWFGAITPLGGFAFLLGWLALAYSAFRSL
jgi:uncharacterized membrane protein YgdD (TMEM256/DUF423 family)